MVGRTHACVDRQMDRWIDGLIIVAAVFKTNTDVEILALHCLCLSVFGDPWHPDHKSGVPENVRFSSFLFVIEKLLLYSLMYVQEEQESRMWKGFLFSLFCFNWVLYWKKCFLFKHVTLELLQISSTLVCTILIIIKDDQTLISIWAYGHQVLVYLLKL